MRCNSTSGAFMQVSGTAFACIWLLIFGLHATCLAFYALMAAIYWKLPGTMQGFVIETMALAIKLKYFKVIAVVHGLIGVCHSSFILLMVAGSIYHCQLVFYPSPVSLRRLLRRLTGPNVVQLPRTESTRTLNLVVQSMITLATYVSHVIDKLLGRHGLLGVESKYYDQIALVRKLVDVTLQSVQAYNLARLVPRPWLVRGFVALLVANCWASPLLHIVLRRKVALQRLLGLFFDTALDFASTVVITTVLVIPYLKAYDPVSTAISQKYYFDETWSTLMANEFRLVFVASWFDLFRRATFAGGILSCVNDIKLLLQVRTESAAQAPSGARIKPEPSKFQQRSLENLRSNISRCTTRIKQILTVMIVLYGVLLSALHLYVESLPAVQGCRLKVSPWYTNKAGCALMELNCYERNIKGEAAEIASILDEIKPNTLGYLAIRHCPKLHLPPSIKQLPELLTLKIYNSTIVEWGDDAALTSSNHPKLWNLYLVRVNTTNQELPRGLLSPQFPRSLRSIVFSVVDVQELPATIGSIWPQPGLSFVWESSELQAVPAVLLTMQLGVLSLAGNHITELPPALLYIRGLTVLGLGGNPLTMLPEASLPVAVAPPLPYVHVIILSNSQLTSFPAWMDTSYRTGRLVYGWNTPICDRVLLQGMNAAALWMRQEHTLCVPTSGTHDRVFSLDVETQNNQIT